ncbi:MAG: DNA translocase FtsK [Planctomycetes bacterium]|nr:DNA translocase FtsK [Planctomycetota bacterium]
MLRLVGFERPEIEVAMRHLASDAVVVGTGVALKIGTHVPWPDCPTEWFLAEGETLVQYRNTSAAGVVIFDVEGQAEAQSLRNMHLVKDGTLLKPNVDDGGEGRRRELTSIAWRLASATEDRSAPEELIQVLERIFHVYDRESGQVALRTWVDFVVQCASALGRDARAVSQHEVHDAVESCLPHLLLFPDDDLFDVAGGQETKRLTQNVRMANFYNPAGKDLDEEDIGRRILATEFRNESGEYFDSSQQERWRTALAALLAAPSVERFSAVPLSIWEQIFAKDTESRDGLGTRIQKYLQDEHPGLVADYDALDVQTRLDDQEPDAAKALLDEEPSEPDQPAFADLLSPPLRKALEKLANPRSPTVADPLVAIVEQLYAATAEEERDSIEAFRILAENSEEEDARYTRALFRFLYARTLEYVARSSIDSVGVPLEIAPELVNGEVDFVELHERLFPSEEPQDEESQAQKVDESLERAWMDLRLQLVAEPGTRVLRRFSWSPTDARSPAGLAAFARLVLDPADPVRIAGHWADLESWCDSTRDPRVPLSGVALAAADSGPTGRWLDLRRATFREWRRRGICADSIGRYVDTWSGFLEDALVRCVPHDEQHDELEAFLEMETLHLDSQCNVLLATHPIRLRWAGAYLQRLRNAMLEILAGSFRLNPEVDELYFGKLAECSPHRQPPLLSPGHNALGIATREFGWHEEYRAIVRDDAPSDAWVGSIDNQSVTAMARVVGRYLEAHPHKLDGLSVLFISRDGDADHVERLVRDIRSTESNDLVVTVHVVAPREGHEEIARRLEMLETEDRSRIELLPRLRTILHPSDLLETEDVAPGFGLDGQVDLVLVPNLFGTNTSINRRTQGRRTGSFDPLLDDATHESNSEDGGGRKNVSRQFLPMGGDTLLEGWSSLQVWRKSWSRVGEDDRDQVDFFSLQVRFTDSVDLFSRLHDWGHWVVTLDPYVGREQIEASEKRPDVITVQPKVGKNGRYTLVVSSSTGRVFVVERLRRRIRHDLPTTDEATARRVAESIYDTSRQFAPGVVLRALGLGRTTQEILGLVVARTIVEEHRARRSDDVLDAWLSLDELTHWFGGAHRPRADMLRVLGRRDDGGRLRLRFQILEAKFREREDLGRGEAQLARTEQVLRPALTPPDDEASIHFADADIWRRELLAAIEQCSARYADAARDGEEGHERSTTLLDDDIRDAILTGRYAVDEMETILCTVAAGEVGLQESCERSPSGEHVWFRVGTTGLQRVLRSFGATTRSTVDGPEPEAETDRPVETVGDPTLSEVELAPRRPELTAEDGRGNPKPPTTVSSREDHGKDDEGPPPIEGHLGAPELERRYQSVLDCFARFDIRVTRPNQYAPEEGPAFYEVRVTPERSVKLERVLGLDRELHLALALPEHLRIRSFVDRGAVVFQIPKEDAERYFVSTRDLWPRAGFPRSEADGLRVPLGEDARGEVVWLDFGDDSPHLLIGGTTGSGKSVALEGILQGLCHQHEADDLRLLLIDPKGTELLGFEDTEHVEGDIGCDSEDAIELLEKEVAEMERRYRCFKELKRERDLRVRSLREFNEVVDPAERLPWHVVVLDEYADLTADKEDRRKIEALLQRLTQKARAAGIHVIVATQKPSAEILSTAIRSNLPAQLALRVKTAQDSRIVMDETGAEALAGKGDAFFKTTKGVVRVQTAQFQA